MRMQESVVAKPRNRPLRLGRSLVAGSIALVLSGTGEAGAQTGPPASPWAGAPPWAPTAHPEGDSTVVQELDVIKKLPGPALWRVSRGDSDVIVLGALVPLPHLLQWDTARVEHALDGANALLLPAPPHMGFFSGLGFMMNRGALELPRGQTLETTLPPRERARFEGLMKTIGTKPDIYNRYKPAVAGAMLIGAYRKAAGLSNLKPGTTVAKLALAENVPVRFIGDFDESAFIKTAATLSPQIDLGCFDAAVSDIDNESAHAQAAARDWANADLKAVRNVYSVSFLETCLVRLPGVGSLVDRGTEEGVRVIQEALNRPGKTVAVIDLNFLLRKNGVLDRLKAMGDTVSVPTE